MAQQYIATDRRSGLEVAVTGAFPDDPEDRVRIARTATLFTRLFATILTMPDRTQRHEGFRAVETQLEVAEALLRGDMAEVQRLLQQTMTQMGVTEEQLQQVQEELRRQLTDLAQTQGDAVPGDAVPGDAATGEADAPPAPHDPDSPYAPEALERGPFGAAFADTSIELGPPADDMSPETQTPEEQSPEAEDGAPAEPDAEDAPSAGADAARGEGEPDPDSPHPGGPHPDNPPGG